MPSPGYCAVRECVPTANDEVVRLALLPLSSAPLAMIEFPSSKFTVPVVAGAPGSAEMTTLKVTG